MVSNNQSHQQNVAHRETKQLAVANNVHRMLVMASGIDKSADLMQQCGQVKDQFHALVELVFFDQVREQLS